MPNRQRNFSLPPDAHRVLDEIDNASKYVSDMLIRRHHQWVVALTLLHAYGWSDVELRAACDALDSAWLLDSPVRSIGYELVRDRELADRREQWGIDAADWIGRARMLGEKSDAAEALMTIVLEFWAGNNALIDRLRS